MNVDGREASMTGSDIVEYTLRLGDDALIAAQRLAEWSARAPEMEEDIALSNIALDQLGMARLLLSYAGEQSGRSEDDLAYLRDDADFRNCLLVELPNAGPNASPGTEGDFGVTMTKLLFLSAYQWLLYGDLSASADERLAAIAAKARKESAYHLDHSSQWMIRLGDGTDESHRRIQLAVTELWPYTHELCQSDELIERLAAAGIAAAPRPEAWRDIVTGILDKATVEVPADGWAPSGGRRGQHTEHLSYLLGELQVLHRAHPGARW